MVKQLPIVITYLSLILLLAFIGKSDCKFSLSFNVTVGRTYEWKTDSFTTIGYDFLTKNTSGTAVYTDLSSSDEFETYSIPTNLNGYDIYGVFQMNMQNVNTRVGGAFFSFTHSYVFGILNVNPKELTLVGVDMDLKKFVPIDYVSDTTQFTQKITLPIETKVYTFAILGLTKEISAQFGVDTLVNYRASIRYEIHKDLNQYLSAFVNRPLSYPAHEYSAQKIDNHIALPSSQLVEIVSFSFNPMFTPCYNGKLVTRDFMFSFDLTKGFVDRNGKQVDIDFKSLACLYILDEKQGFVRTYSSLVFPGWQKLACTPDIGENNFFPKQVTIVARLKQTNPTTSTTSTNPKQTSVFPRNGASSCYLQSVLSLIILLTICYCLLV